MRNDNGDEYQNVDNDFHGFYFCIFRIQNVSGKTGGRDRGRSGVGAGAGPNSAAGRYNVCVLGSIVIVRAPIWVFTVSNTENFEGDSS